MLTKPILMSPDATIVHADDGHIKLTATFPTSCSLETFVDEEGVTRCYASLFMSDGQYNYRIFSDGDEEDYKEHFYPTYIKENDSIKVTFNLDLSNENLHGIYHTLKNESDTKSKFVNKYIKINDLSAANIYRWKIRVYEKNSICNPGTYVSNTKIGYGSISSTVRALDSSSNVLDENVVVTTFAHTNINDWIIGEAPYEYDSSIGQPTQVTSNIYKWYLIDKEASYSTYNKNTQNILEYVLKSINYIDQNNKYYIKINGTQYPILKYRQTPIFYSNGKNIAIDEKSGSVFLPSGWYDEIDKSKYRGSSAYVTALQVPQNIIEAIYGYTVYNGSGNNSVKVDGFGQSCFDSYGNPLSGYALIDTGGEIPCEDNTTYTLCCNYIDSDEGYFEIYSKPTVTLIEENRDIQFTDTDSNIVIGTEANPYTLAYCNVDISAAVSQAEGVEHEYYYYKIYEYSDRGKYEIIHHSGNIYNSDIRVTYDDFLDNRKYKLVISIVDVNQQTIERELYFKTEFPYLGDNSMVKAEYYRDHNSVVVEWSLGNSITPTIKNNNYEYVSLNNSEESDAVVLGEDNVVTYTQNDFGQKLNFENSTFALKFKLGTNAGNVAEVHTKDGYFKIYSERDVDSTCDNRIVVETRNGCYYSEIKRIASLEETIEALSTGVSPANRTLQWNNELVWNDDYIWVNGQDTNADEYLVVANSNDRVRIINLTIDEEFEVLKRDGGGDFISESKIILYGDTTFTDMALINDSDISVIDNLVDNEWLWTEGTQVMCLFNNTMNGAMVVTTSNSKLIGYKIYKTIGDGIKLYKIADIDNLNYNVIEDFVVGDNCKYQYYLFPIYQDELNNKILYCNNPVVSNEIMLHQNTDKIFGLKKIKDNTYCVDLDNVWRIQLNLEDTGYTLNNSKTFFDTLNTYQQEYVGNMKYITKSVSGLIGAIDCNSSSGEIVDTYDMLTSWNEFATSGTPKCLVDIRGIILPGNFEANPTIEYIHGSQSLAVAKFNWRQKSDLNIINIYATVLPYNPVSGNIKYLRSRDELLLMSSDDKVLLVSEGDVL